MPEQDGMPEGTPSETQVAGQESVQQTPAPQGDVDIDKTDNLSQLREYAKGLKTDLERYKPASELIESKFGSAGTAEVAANLYSGFAGDEFDPDKFLETINQLSPSRAKQLTDKLSAAQSEQLAQAQIEKLFGSKPTPEEISLFKKFKESGYGLGEGDDIPEALKFNADGTPKSDEEIQFLRDLQRNVKETKSAEAEKAKREADEAETARQTKIQEGINSFSTERLKVLDKEFSVLGLDYAEQDTAQDRADKDFIKSFIRNGIAGAFMEDPEGAAEYQKAIGHISAGEPLFATRSEPKIEAKLLEIFRSNAVGRMLKSLATNPAPPADIPEINEAGTATGKTETKGRVTGDDIFTDLVNRGLVKP